MPADIAFRFLQRLSLATAERLERLLAGEHASGAAASRGEVGRPRRGAVGRRDRDLARGTEAALAVSPTSSVTPFAKLAPCGAGPGDETRSRPPLARRRVTGEDYLMDGIQLYGGPPHPPASHAIAAAHAPAPSLPKGSSDYLRALRRRTWLVLAIGVTLSVAGAVVVVRLPAVYRATAQISIEPPTYDATLSTLVSHDVGRNDPEAALKYVPNQLVKLQSKGLAEQVVSHPDFDQPTHRRRRPGARTPQ